MNKKELELYAWILRGKQRQTILKAIEKPMTPKIISQKTKIKFSNVSDALKSMKEKGLVICLNPKEKTGRLYDLTKLGKLISREL